METLSIDKKIFEAKGLEGRCMSSYEVLEIGKGDTRVFEGQANEMRILREQE